jgi:hypothetical protein
MRTSDSEVPAPHPDDDERTGAPAKAVDPISFVVCVSDEAVLAENLLASPCLGPGSPHEIIAVQNPPSAATGLNPGLERAKHDLVVCVHQDVFLPARWDRRIVEQYRRAEERFGPIGVAGVYSVGDVIAPLSADGPPAAERIGRVVDRERVLENGPELPARVATLDELLLVVPRESPLYSARGWVRRSRKSRIVLLSRRKQGWSFGL